MNPPPSLPGSESMADRGAGAAQPRALGKREEIERWNVPLMFSTETAVPATLIADVESDGSGKRWRMTRNRSTKGAASAATPHDEACWRRGARKEPLDKKEQPAGHECALSDRSQLADRHEKGDGRARRDAHE